MKHARYGIPSSRGLRPAESRAAQWIALAAKLDSFGSHSVAVGWFLLLLSVLLLALFRATPVKAAGVVGTGTPESCTEAALDAALADGGLVTFDCGAGPFAITVTRSTDITSETTIDGAGLLTLSPLGRVVAFDVSKAGLTLRNLTIDGEGAGIDVSDSTSTLAVSNCTFSGLGGASEGAAINNRGTATVANSTFEGNSGAGGTIFNSGTVTVASSTFEGNLTLSGGAITTSGTATVTNSTFEGNALYAIVNSGTATIANTTVAGGDRGVYVLGGTLKLTNTIVASRDYACTDTVPGTVVDGGHNLIEDAAHAYSCTLADGVNGNIVGVDPLFDPAGLQGNGGPTDTIALLDGSPAIDAGDPEACANPPVNGIDQRGHDRPATGSTTCSIGALEFEPPGPPTCTGDCNRDDKVAIAEVIVGVNIALGRQPLDNCPDVDRNAQNGVEISELITAVSNALKGCALDPTRPGPFGVGVRQITFTKPSETQPGEQRVLLTDVWYPTAPGAGPVDGALGGVRDAPLADGARALPLLLFSHGRCWFPEESRFLTTTMASYGFIVAAPAHPGDVFGYPNCLDPERVFESVLNREPDLIFVIDALLQLDAEPTSFLHAAVDPARIGVSGHSFGGQTALLVGAHDPRAVAVLALAPWLLGAVRVPVGIPVMVQGGTLDRVAPLETHALREYDTLGPPRYLLEIERTGHYAFSDDCYPGFPCQVAGALTQDEAHRYVLRYAVPFLLHWVARNDRFDAFLAPRSASPGVLFTADVGDPGTTPRSSPSREGPLFDASRDDQ
jgi:predicted dienelactone hydrolase